MIKNILIAAALMISGLTTTSTAATLVYSTTDPTKITGATGVIADGYEWDISFYGTANSCIQLHDGCDEQSDFDTDGSTSQAQALIDAIADQIFSDNGIDLYSILGMEDEGGSPSALLRMYFGPAVSVFYAPTAYILHDMRTVVDYGAWSVDWGGSKDIKAAVATRTGSVSPVPLPAAFSLLSIALFGLHRAARRRS